LAKEEILQFDGVVQELLPNASSRVLLDNGHSVICTVSGKMRKMRIRVLSQDRVKVEVSPYDLKRGRISFRY
tara:strand:- start:285 stop:500 length:216 start_codon:yes stop_codon:yes gene_type:complete